MEAGSTFRLLAALEAETWKAERIFYTDAAELWLGDRRVETSALRPWNRPEEIRIRWFSVEGSIPYLEIENDEDLNRFNWREVYRADWPSSWSVPGSISSASQIAKLRGGTGEAPDFGTQRYHVRIEFFGSGSQLRPTLRLKSPGAESLPDHPERVTTAVALLPESLKVSSMVFGLSHLEPTDPLTNAEVVSTIGKWSRSGLVYSRLFVLRRKLVALGIDWEDLDWKDVDLVAAELPWGEDGARAGDLIRVGSRVVEIYRDQGIQGRLDGRDLCLDYEKAATISSLDEIFTGDGLIEWAEARSQAGAEGEVGAL
jgi:hypothetical protein